MSLAGRLQPARPRALGVAGCGSLWAMRVIDSNARFLHAHYLVSLTVTGWRLFWRAELAVLPATRSTTRH